MRANLKKYQDRFIGIIAGEAIAYARPNQATLNQQISAAKSRAEVLAALRAAHTEAVVKFFSTHYATPVSAQEAWSNVVSCLSIPFESMAHALGSWGVRNLGHENYGSAPTAARSMAFMRGAARQFNLGIVEYQSANLGDSATIFTRQDYFTPASSRYILDNNYDAYAGAGLNWILKDYLLFYLAGSNSSGSACERRDHRRSRRL